MIRIPLSQGQVAIVDDEDADLAALKWFAVREHRRWYAVYNIPRRLHRSGLTRRMHRIVLERKLGRRLNARQEETDHVNRNGLDNRRSNLRPLSHADNIRNNGGFSNNTSGKAGVYWDKSRQIWRVEMQHLGKHRFVGRYADFNDAVAAREQAEAELA